MKKTLVIPSCRVESLENFFAADTTQEELLQLSEIIIVWDGGDIPEMPFLPRGLNLDVVCWRHIDSVLAADSWIIPRSTSAIRSFGFMLAYWKGAEMILTCDDDVVLLPGWAKEHEKNLMRIDPKCMWRPTTDQPTRGYPYSGIHRDQEIVISHGLWEGVADWDAPQTLQKMRGTGGLGPGKYHQFSTNDYFPMCGMNLAFKRKATPLMYFGLQGQDWPYDRFDDIWCGVMAQKICRHLHKGIWSGDPVVRHLRASDPFVNLEKEAPGIGMHERFWRRLDDVILTHLGFNTCLLQLADNLPDGDYWSRLNSAYHRWVHYIYLKERG